MSPARLALLLPRLSRYGGVEGVAWRLAEALVASGRAVDFICGRQETAAPPGVRVRCVGRPPLTRAGKMLWFAWAAERVRRKGGYDLSLGLGRSPCQEIVRLGGGPLDVFWRLSARAYAAGWPRRWKMLRRRLSPANLLTRHLERVAIGRAAVVVCVSDIARDWLCETYPWLAPERVRVIYNRPDRGRFAPLSRQRRALLRQEQGIGPDDVVVATAGTNFALKGLDTLIRALALLPSRFRLRVAGARNPVRYCRLAAELGLADRIVFLGRVESMPDFYGLADIFALPSFFDACSNAVLEALSCGVKTISTRDNGSSRLLPANRILADAADVQALAAMLAAAEAEPAPTFTWPSGLAAGPEPYLELVEELLAARRR